MAYIYQITFEIHPDQMNELQIGASLERTLGYLRTLLPSEPGYITIRVARSIDVEDDIHLVVESEWDTWRDLEQHRDSSLAEEKILEEFEPHVALEGLTTHILEEVA